ncbi:hypothetical protein J6525_46185, partial [Bradyrhizobium sp. WSM 4400]|nr:hypothetical protein [Bradyrhizobium australafricanum]
MPESSAQQSAPRLQPCPWQKLSTAGHAGTTRQEVRITHPFHPLCGRKFELICRRRHWGEDRVVYEGQ